ncbi:MAG: YlbF family regulator [Clostridiales bacterium]|jgi:cell fate (sporulation/competence/biofilm development) regulator YlbF (YheA/YmcA/DUF963 family)|nr:YlbF family regulator [Clostridiales bacterium]
MDIIEKARELGKMIQQDERYKAYYDAKEKNDKDEELQALIGEFNLKRVDLNREMSKDDKDMERLRELDSEIKSLYGKIMANPNMEVFNDAKNAMDELLSQINTIITASANGEDPETCATQSSCGGSCAGCSGCN